MIDPTQTGLYGRIAEETSGFTPSTNHLRKYETASEFEEDYNSQEYVEPWVSAIVVNDDVAYNKKIVTSITFSSLTWIDDVPATGGTATKDNCACVVIGHRSNGSDSDITHLCTISGSLNVPSSSTEYRHTAGTLTLTATYSGMSDSKSVEVYQAAAYVPITSISLDYLTWVVDIPNYGGTASKDNCTYTVTAHYANGTTSNVTNLAVVTGSTIVPETSEQSRHSAGTLTLTASYSGFTASDSVDIYQSGAEAPYSERYLTFDIISGGTIAWNVSGTGQEKVIQYSLNGGAWNTITASTATTITVEAGDKVRFKGTNQAYANSKENCSTFKGGTAVFNAEGNIMSLVYGDNFIGNSALTGSYNFNSLFHTTNIISAENLILPAYVATPHCYRGMFSFCSGMTVAPELPAMTLAESCYRFMFEQCKNLTTAPYLLAPVLAYDCYDNMFFSASKINYIKCLAKDISAQNSTSGWVNGVASRGTFVQYDGTPWDINSINGIPVNWTIVSEGIKKPVISCDGLNVTITCATQGVSIYYRLNETGAYTLYSASIPITADTVVEAYAELSGETSITTKETCVYDDGIEEPVIYCDGEFITISCDTGGATIYYRLEQTGTYTPYESAILISADTICESYSEIDGRQSEVVSANCIYDDSLKEPTIECDGEHVYITAHPVAASIYYRLNREGTYSLYDDPITISADTIVEAYAEYSGETSLEVIQMCIYNPIHDYSKDYLTLRVVTTGTIPWTISGSTSAKTIEYSINDGAWTPITASTSTTISVVAGDVVRLKGTNTTYAKDNNNFCGFYGGSAFYEIEGNIMSLLYGDNFSGMTTLPDSTYVFSSMFKMSNATSAKNLVLPALTLTPHCYRALFSKASSLAEAPKTLPATTLATNCYWYMFEECPIETAPEILAETLVALSCGQMFLKCNNLNYIKCLAVSGINASNALVSWTSGVAATGTFVKNDDAATGNTAATNRWAINSTNGIPSGWTIINSSEEIVEAPVIFCDGEDITLTCKTLGAIIYYRLNHSIVYTPYTEEIHMSANTFIEAYAEKGEIQSSGVSQNCVYNPSTPYEASNKVLSSWTYNNLPIETPYSVNRLDGHSASYAKGTFNFETTVSLKKAQPTYLWFQHADQSATIYVDNNLVEKHWGGYTAFFVDITNFVHKGVNNIKVALKNNEGNNLAPASADFNFNATLGNVKLCTSPYLPAMNYGYDGFHVTSDVATSSATIYVRTTIPTGAVVTCEIDDGTYHYGTSANSTGDEMVFSATVVNPHLWNGTLDPHLYDITMEIYHDGDLYHRYVRPYGLRFYEYAINMASGDGTYTGFLLNGQPYLLRGCCMHDDIAGKANALDDNDYATTFATIQELGLNFLRLAHYPHPRETYDWCDRLGIVVQTEGPCVNKMQSTMPTDYYDHLNTQYDDMVNQHYNHPCIIFWGLSNETTTDDKEFAKTKINGYIARIRALDNSRLIGYVMAQGPGTDPSGYYNDPDADWFGCNIYDGWYTAQNSNDPTGSINTRLRNVLTNKSKILCYSEYGCGGTQHCHSDDFMTTTTRGNNPRHDIEYMMWLHEGEIAAIKNFPQLAFTSQWQLFDIAVSNRNEGYTVCLDGETTSTDDNLRRLNDKGLVERDHVTKKDPFYLYKAWWNPTPFIHICGKDYTKKTGRVIKCYTNNTGTATLYVNGTQVDTASITDNIVTFTQMNFSSGDVIRVDAGSTSDTFTFE